MKPADQVWSDLVSSSAPAGVPKTSNAKRKSHEDINAEIRQQAAQSRQLAESARDFYNRYPDHVKAIEARKLEAIASLRGTESDNSAQIQTATLIAKAYRENKSYPAGDRFEVALALERLALSLKIKSGQAVDQPANWRKLGDDLKGEFGDLPALQAYFMDLARTVDNSTAVALARDVKNSPSSTKGMRAQAQVILERAELVGKKIALRLSTAEGGEIDLLQPRAKPVVVFVWSPTDAEAMVTLRQYQNLLQSVDLMYLAIGGSAQTVRDAKKLAPYAGPYCHAPAGKPSRMVIEALKLQYAPIPRVYVFDGSGTVVGSGPVKDLPTLLARVRG